MNRLLTLFAIFALCLTGCHHVNSNLTPGQQTQINLYASLNLLASANHDVAQSVASLNKAGSIPDTITREFLNYSQHLNDGVRASLVALAQQQTPEQKAQAVINYLKTLQLPPPVNQFLNSNPSVQAVVALVNSIVSIQNMVAQIVSAPVGSLNTANGVAK